MAVRHPPCAVLAAKDGRHPDGDRSQLIGSAHARSDALYLNRVRKLPRDDGGDVLELVVLAVAVLARGQVEPIRYRLPAADGRSERIGQRDVVASRPQRLVDLRIAPCDLEPGAAVLLHGQLLVGHGVDWHGGVPRRGSKRAA